MHAKYRQQADCTIVPPFPRAEDSKKTATEKAIQAFHGWCAAIATRNPALVVGLYAEDAILVPTVSDDIRETQAARLTYFEKFLSNEGLACEVNSLQSRVSAKVGTVAMGGLYTFTYREKGLLRMRQVTIPARFLFTFEEIDGEWLITSHHSSKAAESKWWLVAGHSAS